MKLKFDKDKYPKYPFISDGMFSVPGLAEGRLIPCLIIDKSIAPDVDVLCKAHSNSEPGDVITVWTRQLTLFKPKELVLKIQFKKPIETTFGIIFNISKHYSLVDAIINSQSLKIEAGNIGDKVSQQKNPDILLEVPRTDFVGMWENLLENTVYEKYKKDGLDKKKANSLAREHIKSMRDLFKIRR